MKTQAKAHIRGLVAGLFITALIGCGDEGGVPPAAGAATQEASASCKMVDATEPEVARLLQGAKLTPLGPATETHVDGRKISTLRFQVESTVAAQSNPGGSVASMAAGNGTIICTGGCTGKRCGSPNGCDAVSEGCTAIDCQNDCDGSCMKTTVYTPTDAGVSDAGTQDAGASDSGIADAGPADAGPADAGAAAS
ncbi:hypothetical protein OV208_13665 [Corallococcus sp. bb12-1]|uniref:hypothetical protein n=1 Tax=Corallococcus sp. bb12-1 TaxID=2996784 RepID=UPI00226DF2BC|nr:hypothetical protein [Corallococcus sp. bb12-1]MCY1042367.1 hypothetical protein [Corallococcus sp. bb12-1]